MVEMKKERKSLPNSSFPKMESNSWVQSKRAIAGLLKEKRNPKEAIVVHESHMQS
jgi:hypothetical protein